jgi:hypothetical protein
LALMEEDDIKFEESKKVVEYLQVWTCSRAFVPHPAHS